MNSVRMRRGMMPLTALLLGSAVFAGTANAQKPTGGPLLPAAAVTYNTGEILYTDPAANPTTVSVKRGAAALATGTFNAPDPLAPGEFGVNSAHLALAGTATGCWNSFVPQMLPGDVVTLDGETISIPDITAEPPVVEGNAVVVHGTAVGVDTSLLDIEIAPAGAGKFAGGVGSSGGQFLSSLVPRGFAATFSMDPGSTTKWTARFTGLDAGSFALASAGTASVVFDPAALAAVDPPFATTVGYEAGATPGSVPGCGVPYAPNEAKSASRSLINVANVGTDLTVTGVSQPGASATGITLIDSTGKTVAAPAVGAGTWTATVPAAQLAGLSDGAIKIASTYSIGAGKTVSGLLNKDATAPSTPTASVAAGAYSSAQNVALSAADGTIRYTTDGSDPTASSKAYSKAIPVSSSQTIKAVAIDAAGNVSDIASFAYNIAQPVAAPAPVQVIAPSAPRLKLDALTLGSRYRLKTVRKRGFSMVVFAPEGAKVIKIRLLRNGHVVTRLVRKVSSDGVMTVTLPTTKTGRRHLKRGTYKVQVTPGQSASHYGVTTTRTVRIR